ncbi:MAG: hypothetical protein K0B07_02885 [DPANN group archaeon]|nr:hypothetical protein [DPANN group archaeon]
MDTKILENMIDERNKGKTLSELSKKYEIPRSEIKKKLQKKMGDKIYTLDIDYNTDNGEKIQKMLHDRILEILEEYHPDAEIPSTAQKFVKIHDDNIDCCIGLDIKATYYDTVVQSAWKYKKYHEKVGQLYIILISRRLTKEKFETLIKDKPDNVTIIPYTDLDAIENIRKKLMTKK